MNFFNKYYKSNYEELLTFYPRFYRNVFEMVEILKAFGRVSDDLESNVERVFLNSFILTADADMIEEWEGILHITYTEQLSLDQRKRVVIARLLRHGHIGEQEIREIIGQYTKRPVDIGFLQGIITILIEGDVFDEENLLDTLLRSIPAHLALKMTIHIRKQYRQTIPFSHGGAVGSNFLFDSKASEEAEITTRNHVYVMRTSITSADLKVDSPNPDVKRTSTRRRDSAGGIFYYTHTKSKLIE